MWKASLWYFLILRFWCVSLIQVWKFVRIAWIHLPGGRKQRFKMTVWLQCLLILGNVILSLCEFFEMLLTMIILYSSIVDKFGHTFLFLLQGILILWKELSTTMEKWISENFKVGMVFMQWSVTKSNKNRIWNQTNMTSIPSSITD